MEPLRAQTEGEQGIGFDFDNLRAALTLAKALPPPRYVAQHCPVGDLDTVLSGGIGYALGCVAVL